MKIIDVHAHTGKWMYHSRVKDEDIIGILDRFHIEKAVFSSSRAILDSIVEGNRENYDFVIRDERCYAYIVVNPNDLRESEKELSKYIGKNKTAGVKMHPYYFNNAVNSPESKELIKAINSYGLPILIHSQDSKESRPINILEVAQEYPNNIYIIAHMGNRSWREAIKVAEQADNIYMDIVSTGSVYDQISEACENAGVERVLYGSDLSLLDPGCSIGMVLSSEISDRDKEKVFYYNALKLFAFN